jgi:hypothetical protein
MRWNWLRDKTTHDKLRIYWDKGQNNQADYFTKHHPPTHHLAMRPKYVLNAHNLTAHTVVHPSPHLGAARVCCKRDRYPTVNFSEQLKCRRSQTVAMLTSQLAHPHN